MDRKAANSREYAEEAKSAGEREPEPESVSTSEPESADVSELESTDASEPESAGESGPESAEVNLVEPNELSALAQKVLQVERGWWKVAATRAEAISKLTGMSEARYYLLLSALLDQPRFWQADPVLVDRLRRLRQQKMSERLGGDA